MNRKAFFVGMRSEARFAIATFPKGAPKGGWLYIHPFAEEMNKSRRMVALGAQSLAEHGWIVLQIDLAGCGDSAGNFGDTDWDLWLDDISRGWSWLRRQFKEKERTGIWTLRAGSLLASHWLEKSGERPPLLLWQPISNGQHHLTQFLRLAAAREMLTQVDAKLGVAQLRSDLAAGHSIQIAGYELSPGVAAGLSSARLQLPSGYPSAVTILEVTTGDRSTLSPSLDALVREWLEAGVRVERKTVSGPLFWQTQEIETAPSLISTSVQMLSHLIP